MIKCIKTDMVVMIKYIKTDMVVVFFSTKPNGSTTKMVKNGLEQQHTKYCAVTLK